MKNNREEISLFDEQQFETHDKKFELKTIVEDDNLIKSKDRVQHHGEVFTPKWMVKKMLAEPAIQENCMTYMLLFLNPVLEKGHS